MLVLCYGIMKSGSTLAFELVKGMLESIGQTQTKLPDGPVDTGRRNNFIGSLDGPRIDALIAAIGSRSIAVKTHCGFKDALFPELERRQARGELQIVASYRDPRDNCLSLLDAGAKARARGVGTFSRMTDIDRAISSVKRQIPKFRKWGSVDGALRLDYETVAFSPDDAISQIESRLKIVCDRKFAKKHAFEDAFTQRNKAQKRRFEEELGPAENERLMEEFGPFIRDVCRSGSDEWFHRYRKRLLARLDSGTR